MSPELIRLDSTDSSPIYVQIERGIRAAVAIGRLPKGAQLPTVRELAVALLLAGVAAGWMLAVQQRNPIWLLAGVALGGVFALSPRVANQWERAIVLRLGRYIGSRGPGLFWVIPFAEGVSTWIDQRT